MFNLSKGVVMVKRFISSAYIPLILLLSSRAYAQNDSMPERNSDQAPDLASEIALSKDEISLIEQSKDPVVKALLTPQFVASRDTEQALGWLISTDAKGKKFAWHGGQTGGFSAFVGFYLDGSKALVMLNNQSVDITRQAVDLLTGKTTLDS